MFWDIVGYGISIGLWIAAIVIALQEKPWQTQQTEEEPSEHH
jgi:hypothetical protein